jgi:hypothetical protein
MKPKEIIFHIEESLDGGYEAQAAGHSIFTEAETIDELKKNIVEAVKCHFDTEEMPSVISLRYLKEEYLSL